MSDFVPGTTHGWRTYVKPGSTAYLDDGRAIEQDFWRCRCGDERVISRLDVLDLLWNLRREAPPASS